MIAPMLAKQTDRLPAGTDYLYEIKLDGQRTLVEVSRKHLLLYTRSFQNVTTRYPELEELCRCLKSKSAVLDGEIVALEEGIPSFELLQQRMNLRDLRSQRTIAKAVPVVYYAFDLLELDGKSLLKTPLLERKKLLQRTLGSGEHVKTLPFFERIELIAEKARKFGYEGIVAKKRNSSYMPGRRTDLWFKHKFQLTESFVVGGWSEGERSKNFGSLLVGRYQGEQFLYCGRVGTGFNDSQIAVLMSSFLKLAAKGCPFQTLPENVMGVHWLKPKLVVEVKFKEWTKAGILRASVFLGLRTDLRPENCRLQSR